jgi:hypothetical protein
MKRERQRIRDLVRAREALRGDLMRARQRASKVLLRHDIIYDDTASAWTAPHRVWLTAIDLGGGAQLTQLDYEQPPGHARSLDSGLSRRNRSCGSQIRA